ncbi:hypothetical protein FRC02_007029 [Tulasnella sp. 418]|nr:hypothetical protein FRC02_007029 [Tulasnella sp. 418]
MPTPEEIPPFKSNLSPYEASNWLKTLVAATGSFSDSGIFRLLSTKFEDDTAAKKWFDELEDTTKQSWLDFKRDFHTRWVSTPLQEAEKEAAWDEFCNHELTYEMIFARDHPVFEDCCDIVCLWLDSHLRLGEATKHEEVDLVGKTLTLIPSFVQAFLEAYQGYEASPPRNMDELVQQLKLMTPVFFKYEWLRNQKSTKKMLEFELKELIGKVDKVLNASTGPQLSVAKEHSMPQSQRRTDFGAHESVGWEPCSPLTSMISISEDSQANESQEVNTPTAEQHPLPDTVEGE